MIFPTTTDLARHHRDDVLAAAADARLVRQTRPSTRRRPLLPGLSGLLTLARRSRRAEPPARSATPATVNPCTERTAPAT